jgi:hypothetical protein
MTISMRTTVYVEGQCKKCKAKTCYYAQLLEMEMDYSIKCRRCNEGYIETLRYTTSR